MIKRKDYQRPMMQVVKVQQTGMLMESGVVSERRGYGTASESDGTEQTWE